MTVKIERDDAVDEHSMGVAELSVVESVQAEEQQTGKAGKESPGPALDRGLVAELVSQARSVGVSIDGEGGLLAQLTKIVVESALEGELTDHLGYDKHQRVTSHDGDANGGGKPNARNGSRSKTVLTKAGPIEIDVPRDRAGTFTPMVVAKRQRRLGSIEDIVSPYQPAA